MVNLKSLKYMFLFSLVSLNTGAFADIPTLRLDGSYGKSPIHTDPYNYSKLDYETARKNPLNIGIKERIGKTDHRFNELKSNLKNLENWKTRDSRLRKQYVKEVKSEFELTEKEKQTAQAYSDRFPNEAKTGKRVYVSKVLKLGDKEYRVNDCWFVGKGDMNGDGIPEIFVKHSDNATHGGARSQIRIFSENGDFVGFINLMTLYSGPQAVYDYDNDGRVELVYMPENKKGEFLILACPADGEELEPFPMGGTDSGNIMPSKPGLSPVRGIRPAPKLKRKRKPVP
ncbi:MAG: FG-GAP repeat domain-containing protein, partial [Candidatus Rifleibacteriota bacterium]